MGIGDRRLADRSGIGRYVVPVQVAGAREQVPVFIGEPGAEEHPLSQQDRWLRRMRGISVPEEVMGSFATLHRLALENGTSFAALVEYAMSEAGAPPSEADERPDPGE